MPNPSTFATASASSGVAGAVAVILCWFITLAHIQVPAEVAASFMVVGAPLLHLVAMRLASGSWRATFMVAPEAAVEKPVA